MPKEIPILFSTAMVQAILDGRKTETRRVLKMKKEIENPRFGTTCFTGEREISVRGVHGNGQYGESFIKSPYGMAGDVLWVRESTVIFMDKTHYVADQPDRWILSRKIPSIHMPKEAARIWLEVVSVGVERLQDISEESAIAEGVKSRKSEGKTLYWNYGDGEKWIHHARHSFRTLWISINPETPLNPWVWVVKFKVLSTSGKPANS